MTRKVFQLSIELDVHAITCPGVWLCPNNGKVSLCIYMFDTWRETSLIYPVFPLLIHEKFKFTKDISSAKSLSDIQNALNSEHLYCELVQWSEIHRSKGIILSNFKTCLSNLLYPADGNKQLITGVDTELLMNPCPPFPGIIAPKIEIATQTTIKETVSKCTKKCPTYVLNPKVIRSAHCGRHEKFRRQRGVCHSDRSGHNENRLRPSSLSKLDNYRTRQNPIDLCDTDNEKNKQRYINSIDGNNNNYISTSPCECCKNRQNSPIPNQSPKCLCDVLEHNNCTVCDKYQHYFNTFSNMGLKKDEMPTEPEYCRASSPSICQYRYHARQLHDRVSSALSRAKTNQSKQFTSTSLYDAYREYDPNEYTVKNYRTESKILHPSKYCDKDSIVDEYDQTYTEYHKSRPITSSAIDTQKLSTNYVQRTKSEDSSRRECSQRKSQKLQKRPPVKEKFNKKSDSYCHTAFSSVYTSNKPKVRLQNNLEMYKPKHKRQLETRNSNIKNTTSFRSAKVAGKTSTNVVFKKSTKKKKLIVNNHSKQSKMTVQNPSKTQHKLKTPKYTVKTIKKCKKNVNKIISSELNNCVDHLIIIERQSVVKLIEEKLKAGELKFSNNSLKPRCSSLPTPIKYSPSKCNNTLNKQPSSINKKITKKTKHPFQRVIINTVITKPLTSKEKSISKIKCNDFNQGCDSIESENTKTTKSQSEVEIIDPTREETINVSSFKENDLTNQKRLNQVSIDSMLDDVMHFFKKQKSASIKSGNTESDESKSEIEIIEAKIRSELESKKRKEPTRECDDKSCKNKTFVDKSFKNDLMNLFQDQKIHIKSENIESDEPKSEIDIIKTTMNKIVNNHMDNQQNEIKKELKPEKEELNQSERGVIMGKKLSEELDIIKKESTAPVKSTILSSSVKPEKSVLTNTEQENLKLQNEFKKEFDKKIGSNTIVSLIDNISQLVKAIHNDKSIKNLDEYIQNSSVSSIADRISLITEDEVKSDDDLDEYIRNSSIATLVDNITQMVKKLQQNHESYNNLDEYIKNSSIATIVENITTQLDVNNRKICQCSKINQYLDKKYSETSSSGLKQETGTSVNEIWKKIPSKFISSVETCVPKFSNETANDISKHSLNSSTSKTINDIYSWKDVPPSTEKMNDSSKLFLSDETITQSKWINENNSVDQTDQTTSLTNEFLMTSELSEKYLQGTSTSNNRSQSQKLKKKLTQNRSSTILPKSSSYEITKSLATGTDEPLRTNWSDETYDGFVTESLITAGKICESREEWNKDPINLMITSSLTSNIDDTNTHNNMKSLAIGTDDSTTPFISKITLNDEQHYYGKMEKPIRVNVNEAFKRKDNQFPDQNISVRIVDDKKPMYIPNEIPIKKLIGALMKTIEYINRIQGVENHKRICFQNKDKNSINSESNTNSERNCYLNIEQLSGALLKTIEYISKTNRGEYNSTDIEIESDNFSNIIQNNMTCNTGHKIDESSQNSQCIFKNKTPSFISTRNLTFDQMVEQNVASILTNPECQIKSNYAHHMLPVLSNQSQLGPLKPTNLHKNDYLHSTRQERLSDSEFLLSKSLNTFNSVNDIERKLSQTEERLNTLIDDEVEKFTQKQYSTTKNFIDKTKYTSEFKLRNQHKKQENLNSSNRGRRKLTRLNSISDHILPDYSIHHDHLHHFHREPMNHVDGTCKCQNEMMQFHDECRRNSYRGKCKCHVEMPFYDDYRRKFYVHLETFYERLYSRAHIRAEQENFLIEKNCFCN